MNSINLKFSNYTLNIKLRSTNTANAIKNILPFKSIVKTWGDEIYFEIPIEKNIDLESDAKDIIVLGEVAYWIDGKCIAIGYGKTPISQNNEIRLAAKTKYGFVSDPGILFSIRIFFSSIEGILNPQLLFPIPHLTFFGVPQVANNLLKEFILGA